jgi:hypothetical protein
VELKVYLIIFLHVKSKIYLRKLDFSGFSYSWMTTICRIYFYFKMSQVLNESSRNNLLSNDDNDDDSDDDNYDDGDDSDDDNYDDDDDSDDDNYDDGYDNDDESYDDNDDYDNGDDSNEDNSKLLACGQRDREALEDFVRKLGEI